MRLSCGADPVGATPLEPTTKPVGAQTQFLPQPGAGSFKRLLGRRSATLTPTGARIAPLPQRGAHRRSPTTSTVSPVPTPALREARRALSGTALESECWRPERARRPPQHRGPLPNRLVPPQAAARRRTLQQWILKLLFGLTGRG